MLTKVVVRNFKRFDEVEIELGNPVVFIGPNNSGKTSAIQALALWDIGLKRWNEKRAGRSAPERRPGVTVNRRDLIAIPVPVANLLWRERRVRNVQRTEAGQITSNIRIDVIVEGNNERRSWCCGLEFDYANEESFYCRPLRLEEGSSPNRMPIPDEAGSTHIAYLPPMSGLAATETRLDHGAVNVRIGEGRTAEVLRNLCFAIWEDPRKQWPILTYQIERLFGVQLSAPAYIPERGEITMQYREHGTLLDLSSSGRGLQQTLLILAYLYANPRAVLLLDEPDAHLEILRQRQIYNLITEVASANGNQIIAASHSEVLLNEAAGRDVVVAFVGAPHRIDDRGSQVLKSLKDIGFEDYYQAEQTGWVLYLEGSTDLAILQALARRLDHVDAVRALQRPFVRYVGNDSASAQRHYHGLREALPNLRGLALFDRLNRYDTSEQYLDLLTWQRREIENYMCTRHTLEAYARHLASDIEGTLFMHGEVERRLRAMRSSIREIEAAMLVLNRGSPWSADTKVSDDFLTPVFEKYFTVLDLPNAMQKKSFYELADHVPLDEIDSEVVKKLDAIARTAEGARES